MIPSRRKVHDQQCWGLDNAHSDRGWEMPPGIGVEQIMPTVMDVGQCPQ